VRAALFPDYQGTIWRHIAGSNILVNPALLLEILATRIRPSWVAQTDPRTAAA